MDFGNKFDTGDEHGRVVQAFTNLVSQHPFKQANSKNNFLDLNDMRVHNDCEAKGSSYFMKCNTVDGKHEGTVEVNSSNLPTLVKFTTSSGVKQQIAATQSKPIANQPSNPSPLSSEYVKNTKQEIRSKLEIWDAEGCQGICQLSRSFSICRSVKGIDEKTSGLITGRRQRTNYESVQIGSEDLKLMKLISSQCKPFTEELPPALSANIKKREEAFTPSCQSLPTIRQELGLERLGGEHYKNNCLNLASKPVAAKPNKQSNTALLKSLFSNLSDDVLKNKCDVKQIDLNKDGKDEIFIRTTEAASCGGSGRCSFTIERRQENRYQTILSGITTSPAFAVLGSQTNGWRDIATRSYLGKEFWSVWKFDGKEYQVVGQRGIDSISNGNIVKSKSCSEVLSSVVIPTQGTQSNSNLALSIDEKVRLIPVKTALIMTNTAIKSGDISKARHYFDMFNAVWSSVEPMIKSKTGNNYRKIEEGIDIAKTAMEPTPPDKWKAMEGLTTAIKAISIVKGDL